MGGIPPACRNQRDPTTQETRASCTALSGYSPRAMAAQKRPRSSRRPTGGRPGDRRGFCTRFAASHLACLDIETSEVREVFRRPIESTQHACAEYQAVLAAHGMRVSMSRKGNCWDNAVAESFFATLELELIVNAKWETRDDARRAIFRYIETWYNRERRHSTIGYVSPAAYEERRQDAA